MVEATDTVKCNRCAALFAFADMKTRAYEEGYEIPEKKFQDFLKNDERIKNYVYLDENINTYFVDWDELKLENRELYYEANKLYEYMAHFDTIGSHYVFDEREILQYATCPRCGESKTLYLDT